MPRRARKRPRILIVTPEIASLPPGMSPTSDSVVAKAGGMADVVAAIVTLLVKQGADVHVALPNFRRLFNVDVSAYGRSTLRQYRAKVPGRRVHFAEDSAFYRKRSVYDGDVRQLALRFQREVINNILPEVDPDLVHCNDWMTGLIAAAADRMDIPVLFTVHNVHTQEITIDDVEDAGIPATDFWSHLYYRYRPESYAQAHAPNRADLLASGVFSSNLVNTVSPTFLEEIIGGQHDFVSDAVRSEIRHKHASGNAAGILNAPPERYRPGTDENLVVAYGPEDHESGKRANKAAFQQRLGLPTSERLPLFFWPSRLDPVQKGCELLDALLPELAGGHSPRCQLAIVADGPDAKRIRRTIDDHRLSGSVSLVPFSEELSRLGFAGSDFTLMPSRFEPCGLPQMIGAMYGSLPVVHATGGLRDTVAHLRVSEGTGNGFVFEHYDVGGLRWATDEAIRFYQHDDDARNAIIARVMTEATRRFSAEQMVESYLQIYRKILDREVVPA